MARENAVARVETDLEDTLYSITVPRGTVSYDVEGEGSFEIALEELTPEMLIMAALHGLKQKVVDAAAIPRNTLTGRSATNREKYEAMKAVRDRVVAGQWNATRGEGGPTTGGLLFEALVRLYPRKTPDELRAYLAKKDKAAQAALRKNPRVASIIEEIKAELAAKGKSEPDSSDDMLDELED